MLRKCVIVPNAIANTMFDYKIPTKQLGPIKCLVVYSFLEDNLNNSETPAEGVTTENKEHIKVTFKYLN